VNVQTVGLAREGLVARLSALCGEDGPTETHLGKRRPNGADSIPTPDDPGEARVRWYHDWHEREIKTYLTSTGIFGRFGRSPFPNSRAYQYG